MMRFSAVLSEQGNVESFAKCVGAVAKMCKKQCGLRITEEGLCFVANETLQGQGNFLSVRIPSSPDFDTFNFVGMSEERNEIVLELDIEVFEKSVAGSCTHLKMKLRQKPEEGPFLQLELRDRLTVHEIPIKLLKTAYWPKYQRPDLPNSMMGIYFPPVKSVMKVLHSLKNVSNKNITLKVSNSGEMHLKCLVDHADITVYFTNLMNDTMTEEQTQEQWYTVRVPLKVVHMFFAGFMYMAHFNVLLNVVSDSYAEFTLRRDGLVVSFLVRGINDVY